MILAPRIGSRALLALALAGIGCGETTSTTPTSISKTPPDVLEPTAPGEGEVGTAGGSARDAAPSPSLSSEGEASATTEPTASEGTTTATTTEAVGDAATGPGEAGETAGKVALVPVKYEEMISRIASRGAKLTMVDAWATWCAPCKENFPHVVQMHRKFADRGLAVASLSLDDPTDSKAVSEAEQFLREQEADFDNFLLDEEQDVAFEKLDLASIPAVFLFGPDGKEIRRFTMDDPNHQFTYDEVEQVVAGMLEGESGAGPASE